MPNQHRKKQRKPPYTGKLFVTMPGGVERGVKLPSAEGVEIGERRSVEFEFKGRPVRVPLVRVAGGWDVAK